jgi:hypothetical protein
VLTLGALSGPNTLIVMAIIIGLLVFLHQFLEGNKASLFLKNILNHRIFATFLLILIGLSIGKVLTA